MALIGVAEGNVFYFDPSEVVAFVQSKSTAKVVMKCGVVVTVNGPVAKAIADHFRSKTSVPASSKPTAKKQRDGVAYLS